MYYGSIRPLRSFVAESARFVRFPGRFLAAALALLLIGAPLLAQINFGRILGKVTDPSGAVVAGATVTVTNTGTNVARTLTTDSSGAWAAAALDPGTYSVRVTASGFTAAVLQ
ncbi:MAG: carboxypeptidase regulatory-like domain-containing protein, partial [Acidobacteriota bacterium]|nr:carboxypeptidase regulatory-like domain-containing protein [Acidobacteriota bacterium]